MVATAPRFTVTDAGTDHANTLGGSTAGCGLGAGFGFGAGAGGGDALVCAGTLVAADPMIAFGPAPTGTVPGTDLAVAACFDFFFAGAGITAGASVTGAPITGGCTLT